VDAVATKQEETAVKTEQLKKDVDAVAQKSETLSGKLSATVAAPPVGAVEVPAGGSIAQKSDSDPRTGCFDTAFLKRGRR